MSEVAQKHETKADKWQMLRQSVPRNESSLHRASFHQHHCAVAAASGCPVRMHALPQQSLSAYCSDDAMQA